MRQVLYALLLVMAGTLAAHAQATRTQLFKLATPLFGMRYYANGIFEDGAGGLPTDGVAIWMLDKTSHLNFAGGTAAYDNEGRFLFRGTGVALVYCQVSDGEVVDWQVIDNGTDGSFNVVASGSIDTAGAAQNVTATLVAAGTLDEHKIHMLRFIVRDTDNGTAKRLAFIDAVDVFGSKPLVTVDNTDAAIVYSNWSAPNSGEGNSIGGGRAYSNAAGSTLEYSFNGPSIAVVGFQQTTTGSTYDWTIDDGAGPSGTVDQTVDRDFRVRFPELIINGLTSAPHTLKITATGNANSGTYQPHSAYTQIDALVYISYTTVPVELSAFGAE